MHESSRSFGVDKFNKLTHSSKKFITRPSLACSRAARILLRSANGGRFELYFITCHAFANPLQTTKAILLELWELRSLLLTHRRSCRRRHYDTR